MYTRAAVLWLMQTGLDKNSMIPGSAIGGKFPVFAPPRFPGEAKTVWPVNKLLSKLKETKLLHSEKMDSITVVVEGYSREFKDVACYAVAPTDAHLVKTLMADAVWADAQTALVKSTKSNKRSR